MIRTRGHKHDILTGSQPDGRAYTDSADHTCKNWTSNSAGSAQLAIPTATTTTRIPRIRGTQRIPHGTALLKVCDAGLLYCFAIN